MSAPLSKETLESLRALAAEARGLLTEWDQRDGYAALFAYSEDRPDASSVYRRMLADLSPEVVTALVEAAERDAARSVSLDSALISSYGHAKDAADAMRVAMSTLERERDEARAEVERLRAILDVSARDPDCRCEEAREDGAPCVVHGFVEPHTHTMYGGFHGGDPRTFTPDPECSTDEERAAHKAACARWDAAAKEGKPVQDEPGSGGVVDLVDPKTGERVGGAFVHRARFGLGVSQWECTDGACDEAQPRDPREDDWDAQVNGARRESAAREALAGDDEDTSDQDGPS